MKSVAEQIKIIQRGVSEMVSEAELVKKLSKGKPLRVKAGFDPTTADLHLGHTVLMEKMRQFQNLGHQVIFLIGDYTAQVGDPSGRDKTRPTLSEKEIKANSKTYLDQAFKILDKKKTEIRRNSEWHGKAKQMELVQLAGEYNVARMLERDDFKKRFQEGQQITIREFLYPLLQGYDSVALKADVELGGQDQKFNLVVVRDILRAYKQEPEVILMMPLLVGTDGQKKMSKSYGNTIGVTEAPQEIFGKVLALTDEQMWHYYDLLSAISPEDLQKRKLGHPKEAKILLAQEIVTRFHGETSALAAAQEFDKIFAKKELPTDIEEKVLPKQGGAISLIEVMAQNGLASSKSDARRLIAQNAVSLNDVRVADPETQLATSQSYLLKVGKRRFLQIKFR